MTDRFGERTGGELDSLQPAQLRRVLMLATDSPVSDAPPTADEAGCLLPVSHDDHGRSEEELLSVAASPSTPLNELLRIRDEATSRAKEASDAPQGEAARLLGRVAVAAAFARFGVDISNRPIQEQKLEYQALAVAFSQHMLGDVFRQVVKRIEALDPPDAHVRQSRGRDW